MVLGTFHFVKRKYLGTMSERHVTCTNKMSKIHWTSSWHVLTLNPSKSTKSTAFIHLLWLVLILFCDLFYDTCQTIICLISFFLLTRVEVKKVPEFFSFTNIFRVIRAEKIWCRSANNKTKPMRMSRSQRKTLSMISKNVLTKHERDIILFQRHIKLVVFFLIKRLSCSQYHKRKGTSTFAAWKLHYTPRIYKRRRNQFNNMANITTYHNNLENTTRKDVKWEIWVVKAVGSSGTHMHQRRNLIFSALICSYSFILYCTIIFNKNTNKLVFL